MLGAIGHAADEQGIRFPLLESEAEKQRVMWKAMS